MNQTTQLDERPSTHVLATGHPHPMVYAAQERNRRNKRPSTHVLAAVHPHPMVHIRKRLDKRPSTHVLATGHPHPMVHAARNRKWREMKVRLTRHQRIARSLPSGTEY